MKLSSRQGSIPKGWRLVRLGEVVQFQQGGTPSKALPEYWNGGIPFVTGADLRETYIGRDNARSFLTRAGLNSGATAICKEGALLLATRTRVGLVGIAGELMGASQDITLLAPTEAADRSYLYRTLINCAGLLQQRSRGTTIQGVSREDVDSLPILLPPLPEQRAIAAVLDSIDDAIESAETVIAATEQLRDSLLHQLLTRGVPGWHTEWKEVPGLGTIPAGWEVVRLGEVCAPPEYGASASARPFDPKLPRYVRITDITDDGRLRKADVASADPSAVDGYELGPGDLLFARSGTVGKTYLYRPEDGPCVYAGYLIRFRPLGEMASAEFLERFTRSQLYWRWVESMFRAGAQPNINAAEYSSLPVVLPPMKEQQAIAALLDGVDATIAEAKRERDGLQLLKESAANALLLGRVRVEKA